MTSHYDLFVIGAGSAGLAAAKRAAAYGAKVAIAEENAIGGTCVNRGCVPKKLMVYASRFADLYADAAAYGWDEVDSRFNWQKFLKARDQEIQRLNQVYYQKLEEAGVQFLKGHAAFRDIHTIEVAGQTITADKILIAVGGHPITPEIPGREHLKTSRDFFHLPQQPRQVAIIGGGYIGVEFACILNNLGTQVTLIEQGAQILSGFDSNIRTQVQAGMAKRGIRFYCGTHVKAIEQAADGLDVRLSNHSDLLTVDTVLAAIGRKPHLQGLELASVGVEVNDKGAIAVDEYSRTTQANIFAVGDCTNRLNLTPIAIAEGNAFADTEFGNRPQAVQYNKVPSAVFSEPEAATVGLTESQAREQGGDRIQCYCQQFQSLFHSLTHRDSQTFMKLVVDGHSNQVLGAHMVGEHAAEIIQGIAIAINRGVTKEDFEATIGIHPSVAEAFVSLRADAEANPDEGDRQ